MTLEEVSHEAHALSHDMITCGFNSYGLKPKTYQNWRDRMERIANALGGLVEQQQPPPPPPPVK